MAINTKPIELRRLRQEYLRRKCVATLSPGNPELANEAAELLQRITDWESTFDSKPKRGPHKGPGRC